jgi:light-regulated signal transduction histidine kinase (bacteriophytochrome)
LHYNADGLDVYLQVAAVRMDEEVVVHFIDNTKLRNLQIDLMRKIEELERSNQNLEEFAYAASHDLKEPIRKINFFADRLKTLLGESLTADNLRLFNRLEVATQRMRSLVDDLLSYSQVNTRSDNFEKVNLNELGFESGVNVSTSEEKNLFHRIEVADNGIGFEQEDVQRIFQVFQRLHSAAEYQGTGLGLSIARKVAENHHGFLSATGELNKGAKFILLLPVEN